MIREKRLAGLDIVRSLAILFVVAHHFDLHTEFLITPFIGVNMFIQGAFASLFLVAVPLFLLLTGFLNTNKKLTLTYYKGIIRVLSAYLVYSIVTILYRIIINGEHLSVFLWLRQIFNYTAIPYGWYIEMYIGLFILIPFLNIIYNNLQEKKNKQI